MPRSSVSYFHRWASAWQREDLASLILLYPEDDTPNAADAIRAAGRGTMLFRREALEDFVDAERLPFLDASFDLVTVRIAPHHYADVWAGTREMNGGDSA